MQYPDTEKTLKFDANGLIPVIVQDHYSREVLTLAYMNAETLALTIAEGRTVFYSRSRQEIWRKGETSGNVQRVVSITADCDKDALVVDVVKAGPACHTGAESCFFNPVYVSEELKQFTWQGLYELIEGRKTAPQINGRKQFHALPLLTARRRPAAGAGRCRRIFRDGTGCRRHGRCARRRSPGCCTRC